MAIMGLIFDIQPHVAFWAMRDQDQKLFRKLVNANCDTTEIIDAFTPVNCPKNVDDLKQRHYIILRAIHGLMEFRGEAMFL